MVGSDCDEHRDGLAEVPHRAVGPLSVGLVDDEHVGDLEDAGLGGLDAVAHPGGEEDHRRVGGAGDLHLRLTHADGLEDDDVTAGRVEHP